MDLGQPIVEVLGQSNEAFGLGWNCLEDGLVESDPDWELYEHGAEAPERIDSLLLVEGHRLAGGAPPFALVLLLNLLHLRLERGHRLDLAALLDREGYHDSSHDQRERDDGNAEVQEQPRVEEHQRIDHRLDDDLVPGVYDKFQNEILTSKPWRDREGGGRQHW